jgi:hypothetical protein
VGDGLIDLEQVRDVEAFVAVTLVVACQLVSKRSDGGDGPEWSRPVVGRTDGGSVRESVRCRVACGNA